MSDFEKVVLADGRATLYRGDCLELLKAGLLKCDAIVSDPPYGISYQHSGNERANRLVFDATGKQTSKAFAPAAKTYVIHGDEIPFDPRPWLVFPRVALFGADNFRALLPEGGSFLCWDKSCGIGPADSFADAEFIWTSLPGIKRSVYRQLWKGLICSGEDNPVKGRKRHHIAQKPRELMRYVIQTVRPAINGVVCDPYTGSGSTGIAALSLGYRFTGVEIDPAHFATACARIEKYWAEHGSAA